MSFGRAFVTGASSGLGRAIALELAKRGAVVHLFARRPDALTEVLDAVESLGGQGVIHVGDVTDEEALSAAIETAAQAGSPALDLVLAGAGVAESGLTELPATEQTKVIFDVNLVGAVSTLGHGRKALQRTGGGSLAAITSLAGLRGLPTAAAYSGSKAGLINYVEALTAATRRESSTEETKPKQRAASIRVTDIRPGFVRTPMTDKNEFPMLFLMDVDDAARRTVDGLERGASVVCFPRRLAWPMSLLAKVMPRWAWARLATLRSNDGR